METTKQKLRSLELYLSAHPDNEENSECSDRLSDVQELLENETQLQKDKEEILKSLSDSLKVIEWYMDNSNPESDNQTDFFNIGMNQRAEIESLIQKHKQ